MVEKQNVEHKGIISSLQALIRGHMVRRQAVATCVMGNVKLKALARGREIRRSDIGVEVHSQCRLNQETKLPEDSVVNTHTYLGIKKLTSNVFARKVCLFLKPGLEKILMNNDVLSLLSASSFISKRDACAP